MKRLFIASLLFSATSLLGFHPASSSKTQKDCKKDCKEVSEKVCRPCLFEKSCSKWYAGAGISFADLFYYSNHQRSNFATADFSANESDTETTDSAPAIGYNVFLGYAYNDYISLEFKGVQIVSPFKNNYESDLSEAAADDTVIGNTKLYVVSFGPYVLINMPLFKALTPFFRFGMVTDLVTFEKNASELETVEPLVVSGTGHQKSYLWLERLNVGMGFKSSWKNYLDLKVEYEMPLSNNIASRTTNATGESFYIPGILSASIAFKY